MRHGRNRQGEAARKGRAQRNAGHAAQGARWQRGAGHGDGQGGDRRGWRQATLQVLRYGYASAPQLQGGTPPLSPLLFGHHPAHPHALFCALICHHAPFPAPRTLRSAFTCPTLSLRFPCPACSCHAACRVAIAPLPPFPMHYYARPPDVSLVSLKSTARDNEVTRSTFVAHVVTISDTHDVTRPSEPAEK